MTTLNAPRPIRFRASINRPCPVCLSGTKACSATDDELHLCRSEPADPASWTCVKKGNPFNSYRRSGDKQRPSVGTANPGGSSAPPAIDWDSEAKRYAAALTPELRKELATILKLPLLTLNGIGWTGSAWTFPECDGSGRIIGIAKG